MSSVLPGLYRHFKGRLYVVEGRALDVTGSRSPTEMVLYHNRTSGERFVRTYEDFVAVVKWPDGIMRPRFIPED